MNYLSKAQDNISDSLAIGKNSAEKIDTVKVNTKSSLDTIVKYEAKDSLIYNLKSKTMRLKTEAKIDYKIQKLNSDHIILNFDNSTLIAESDTTKAPRLRQYPKFADGGQSFIGSRIYYNFKTNQGTISLGETEITDAFYYGAKIKRVSENELFVEDGCYTNCDDPHPHYYFGSPKMKVIVQDKIFIDPIIFYVEDLPIFIMPIGLYFPNKTGRQSGIIIPSFFYSKTRGMTIEDFGVYLALSDYYDTQFDFDYYTKGGYNITNRTRWKLKNNFEGNAELQFGKTRFNPDDSFAKNWSLAFNHNQNISPQSSFNANLRFSSMDFNRNTSNSLNDRIQQSISSRASYSESFDNGASYSIFYNREQNIIDDTYSQTFPSISANIPTLYPLKSIVSPTSSVSWLRNMTISYSGSANFDEIKTKNADSTFTTNNYQKISHSPSISISPKLGYFNITPYINFSANNYFRRITKTYDTKDSLTSEIEEKGFFTEYNYSLGMNISTTLWGILKTNVMGINSLRHQFKPSIGYSYSPDLSSPAFGFYDKYYDEKAKQEITYSRFERDRGGIASRTLQSNLNYSFANVFSMTMKQDTGMDKRVQLLNLNVAGSYNFAADSLKFSNINMSFSTPPIANFNFNGNANFTLYDEAKVKTGNYERFAKINKLLISEGKGLARLTNLSLSLSTSFSESGFFSGQTIKQVSPDSTTLGDRFSQRINTEEDAHDLWGDESPGYSRFSPPWSLNLGVYFSYSSPLANQITRSLNMQIGFTFKLTPTWNITGNSSFDVLKRDLLSPSINITKDLHCWSLAFDWYPIGANRGFYLRFGAKAPSLQDLKLEKRNNPLY